MFTGRHQFPEDALLQSHFMAGITHSHGHTCSRVLREVLVTSHPMSVRRQDAFFVGPSCVNTSQEGPGILTVSVSARSSALLSL